MKVSAREKYSRMHLYRVTALSDGRFTETSDEPRRVPTDRRAPPTELAVIRGGGRHRVQDFVAKIKQCLWAMAGKW
ncbi:hypothetical protein MCOR31_000208 [Pyricularia oryzae]|nr:hypothetical protein MCOR31_000208 [Pyricularia oryzae]